MFLPRVTALTALAAAATFGLATAGVSHAASCDRPINGTYTATSDGQWAKTREVYHDEVSVVATWTVTSSCDDVMHCDGSVTSQQGWTRDAEPVSGTPVVASTTGNRVQTAAPRRATSRSASGAPPMTPKPSPATTAPSVPAVAAGSTSGSLSRCRSGSPRLHERVAINRPAM